MRCFGNQEISEERLEVKGLESSIPASQNPHQKMFEILSKNLQMSQLTTDADLVHCELDVHWVHRGGSNPVEVMKQYEGRIPILHLKDMDFDAELKESFRCPGEGSIDFASILAEADKQGIQHFDLRNYLLQVLGIVHQQKYSCYYIF